MARPFTVRSAQARESKRSAFGAHFPVSLCPARPDQPTAMLTAIKGLSRHKRVPPTYGEISQRLSTLPRVSAVRGAPHLFHDPLTAAARGPVRKASGRGTSFGRDVFVAPLRVRRTGNMTRRRKGKGRFCRPSSEKND